MRISYINFLPLQDVREELRCSMAKDVVTIRNESLRINRDMSSMDKMSGGTEGSLLKDMSSDFQKKITLAKHEKQDMDAHSIFSNEETYRKIAGTYKFVRNLLSFIIKIFYNLYVT